MADLKTFTEIVEKMIAQYGYFYGIIFFLSLLAFGIFAYVLSKRISAGFNVYLEDKKAQISKRAELAFSNESIRKDLRKEIALRSINKKLEMYDFFYKMFHRGLFLAEDLKRNRTQADPELLALREARSYLFLNGIYLNDTLFSSFLKLIIHSEDIVHFYLTCINNPNPPRRKEFFAVTATEVSEILRTLHDWYKKNILTDQEIMQYEYEPSESAYLKSIRADLLKSESTQ